MTDAPPPSSYYDKMQPLGPAQFPYGKECGLSRDAQAAAFHHGLNPANVEALIQLEFDSVLSFSMANPDGNEDQKSAFDTTIAAFASPVARGKVALMFRRLCRVVYAAELPRDGEPKAKKQRVTKGAAGDPAPGPAAAGSGVLGVGEAPAAALSSASGNALDVGAASTSKGNTSAPADNARIQYSSSDSGSGSDSDSDDGDGVRDNADKGKEKEEEKDESGDKKAGKTDKTPKDANSMVVEIGSPVSFRVCVPIVIRYFCPRRNALSWFMPNIYIYDSSALLAAGEEVAPPPR